MTTLAAETTDTSLTPRGADINTLGARVEALYRFLDIMSGRVPVERLATARAAVDLVRERLRLSRDHTVVALAGATGSGKSSLFNALARLGLSRVGPRRPTTGVPHACVWHPEGAETLLDWLGIPKRQQFARETALDGEDEAPLRGLVLIDLPDFDSVEAGHQREVDRITSLADLVIWVLDPQKYADAIVHERYLRRLAPYQDVTVVVLNQIDRLSPAETEQCLVDLRRLLDEAGLTRVRLFSASAVTGAGVPQLRQLLEETIAHRQASLWRVSGDVDTAVEAVSGLVGPLTTEEAVDQGTLSELTIALGEAVGVSARTAAIERSEYRRGRWLTEWPIPRWLRGLRRDPLRRLPEEMAGPEFAHLRADADEAEVATGSGTSHVPQHAATEPMMLSRSRIERTGRTLAEKVTQDLPEPWPTAIQTAACRNVDLLPDALERAVSGVDFRAQRPPLWARIGYVLQLVLALIAIVGLGWLLIGWTGLVDWPRVMGMPAPVAMLVGGVVPGILFDLVCRPLVSRSAQRRAAQAGQQLRAAVFEVAEEQIITPVRQELQAYADAWKVLAAARGEQPPAGYRA